jgi:hypothetical protein
MVHTVNASSAFSIRHLPQFATADRQVHVQDTRYRCVIPLAVWPDVQIALQPGSLVHSHLRQVT